MSRINEEVSRLSSRGYVVSVDNIFDSFTIKEIKDYVQYLRKEVEDKNEQIRGLIRENVEMEVKLDGKGVK